MSERLEHLIEQLASAPIDRSLDALEREVIQGIQRRRAEARLATTLAPVGVASVALAMAMGLTVGAALAVRPADRSSGIAMTSGLAPSTLLEDRG